MTCNIRLQIERKGWHLDLAEVNLMKNRRVFQRIGCKVPVVVHIAGKFLYGELTDLSLGGAKITVKGNLEAESLELSPNKALSEGSSVIPLPYDVKWQRGQEVGLQFSGGTDAFFRGWLSDYLQGEHSGVEALLDQRELIRVPCQLQAKIELDETVYEGAVLDISLGGVSFIVPGEVYPGSSLHLSLDAWPKLGRLELFVLRVQSVSGHSLCGSKILQLEPGQVSSLTDCISSL